MIMELSLWSCFALFFVCAIIIFFAGQRLSLYGEIIAEKTGMGKAWIGLILMSAVTSLPELMVGVSSITIVHSPDLAVGDILGSCAFNLCILSFMDVIAPKDRPILAGVSKSQFLAGAFGIILLSIVGLNLFLNFDFQFIPFAGLLTFVLFLVYLVSVRTIFIYQKKNTNISLSEQFESECHLSLKEVLVRYSFFAVIIIIAALALPTLAESIAVQAGLGNSFMGTLFLAISTSLPEIAVSFAAVRMGSIDMAVGNLFGSNLFNMLILFIDDVLYVNGNLLKDASEVHLVTVFFVVMMTSVAMIGFIFPSTYKRFKLAWDTALILVLFILNMFLLYFIQS